MIVKGSVFVPSHTEQFTGRDYSRSEVSVPFPFISFLEVPMTQKLKTILFALSAFIIPMTARAQTNKTPDPTTATWTVDRYAPQSFSTGNTFQGRNDVVSIGVTSAGRLDNRPGPYQTSFYNYQGMMTAIDPVGTTPAVSQVISMDLWLDQTWNTSANGLISTSMWTRVNQVNSDLESSAWYPIIRFSNQGGTGAASYWNSNIGWIDLTGLGAMLNYGAWNTFAITYTGNSFQASVNGQTLYTEGGVDPGTVRISVLYLQDVNFDQSYGPNANGGAYTANWATSTVPEPSTYVLMASGLAALAFVSKRRKRSVQNPIS